MPHSAASDLGLHCLPNSLLGVSRLKWVNKSSTGNLTFETLGMIFMVHMPYKAIFSQQLMGGMLKWGECMRCAAVTC